MIRQRVRFSLKQQKNRLTNHPYLLLHSANKIIKNMKNNKLYKCEMIKDISSLRIVSMSPSDLRKLLDDCFTKTYKFSSLTYNIQTPGMALFWVMPGFLFTLKYSGGFHEKSYCLC